MKLATKSNQDLEKLLNSIGWDIRRLEIDAISGTAVITAMRDDGLWFFARADSVGESGRGSIDVFRRSDTLGRQENLKRGNRAPLTPLAHDVFILRHRFQGARSMLRGLCSFLADNGSREISAQEIRQIMASSL